MIPSPSSPTRYHTPTYFRGLQLFDLFIHLQLYELAYNPSNYGVWFGTIRKLSNLLGTTPSATGEAIRRLEIWDAIEYVPPYKYQRAFLVHAYGYEYLYRHPDTQTELIVGGCSDFYLLVHLHLSKLTAGVPAYVGTTGELSIQLGSTPRDTAKAIRKLESCQAISCSTRNS